MFRTAVVNVLRKSWLLVVAIVIVSTASLYWRGQDVSLLAFCLISLAALGALVLLAVPVELHKLRKTR